MTLQWAGPILALTSFATIAVGHVLVRRLQRRFSTRPAPFFFLLGGLALLASFFASDRLLSGVVGLLAVTFTWDGIEIFRQERRMKKNQ